MNIRNYFRGFQLVAISAVLAWSAQAQQAAASTVLGDQSKWAA